MGWLLLWCGIGLLWLATMVTCGWVLWRKGKALLRELEAQGRTLGDLATLLGELELPADSAGEPSGRPTMSGRPLGSRERKALSWSQ